jgi:hypothetical protein
MSEPIQITAKAYTLHTLSDRPFVAIKSPNGEPLVELFVPGSIHSTEGQDDTPHLGPWERNETDGATVLSLTASSAIWQRKTYRIHCLPERLRFETIIEGEGSLTDVHYFGGYYSGQIRWGSGFFWSGQRLKRGFNPEPTTDEDPFFSPMAGSLIDATGVPVAGKAGWFFTPPPYLFAFEGASGWLGFGVEAALGHNRYTDYRYHGQRGACYLTLAFDGKTRVSGEYTLPVIGIDFAPDPYKVLEHHVAALRGGGLAPTKPAGQRPDWWLEPIYCGWGSQCYLASQMGGRAPDYARQGYYESFLEMLGSHDLSPGMVVLDDKWQAHYGINEVDCDKWPDLKGFIARQHAAGRRVLLWLKAWDPEGLPLQECVRNAAGTPVAFDPTNPAFEARLRQGVRQMLSPEGYDADGFKLDFSARMPSGPNLTLEGDLWGLELMKCYLQILYSEAKRVKPDALLMTHTPHPYLADVLDMIRLNDINTESDIHQAMIHRARVAQLACPDAIIDTDNWPIPNREAWRSYTALQPELGVPSLYFATHIDATGEALEPEDYRQIAEVWARHRAKGRA